MLNGVSLRKAASGGSVELGTSTDPIRTDPTGVTTQPVSVSNFPASQSVTLASIPLASGAATSANQTNGSQKTQLANSAGTEIGTAAAPVRTDPTGTTTQPVSIAGTPTVTSNIGTTNGLALDATLSGGTQRTKLTDGTNNAAIASSAPAGTEQGLITRNIPSGTQGISAASLPLPAGAATEATIATMNGKLPSLGQTTMSASQPVAIATDQSDIPVKIANSTNKTYWASNGATAFTPVATATDMIGIQCAASTVCRVLDFVVCPVATTAGSQTVFLAKRSTANSGGTSTIQTATPLDSNNSAAAATVRSYGTNPTTPGTLVGSLRARKVFFQIAAGTTAIEPCTNVLKHIQDNPTGQPVVLRGAAESLYLNNNAATLAAGYSVPAWYIVWTEGAN
jgi:hypothetical protein